jgi:acyl-CoA reductase-like NAD-dependent aldehyde dehydrogenase
MSHLTQTVPVFTPSQTDLLDMIKRAEAKFAACRERDLSERAEIIFAQNLRRRRTELGAA